MPQDKRAYNMILKEERRYKQPAQKGKIQTQVSRYNSEYQETHNQRQIPIKANPYR